MKKRNPLRGIISVAFMFIIVISVIFASMVGIFWSRIRLSGARLQRFHTKAYAEAALYEAVKRFHQTDKFNTGWGASPYIGTTYTWEISTWADNSDTYEEDIIVKPSRFNILGLPDAPDVAVTIKVIPTETPTSSGIWRWKITATIDYSGIKV